MNKIIYAFFVLILTVGTTNAFQAPYPSELQKFLDRVFITIKSRNSDEIRNYFSSTARFDFGDSLSLNDLSFEERTSESWEQLDIALRSGCMKISVDIWQCPSLHGQNNEVGMKRVLLEKQGGSYKITAFISGD